MRSAQRLDIERETGTSPGKTRCMSVDVFSERTLSKYVDSTILPEQLPRGRAPAGQQLKQQLRENSTADVVRVRAIVYYVCSSHKTYTARSAYLSLECAHRYGAQADLLDQPAISRATPAAGPNTRITDGATRDPGACCKSCYPRSTSTTRRAASCCQNCQLKYNRRGATSR